ncbi:MAG: Rap1a/Tai family immunity protein [Allosphingosinicella sp.]
MRAAFGVLAATLTLLSAAPAAAQTMPTRASGRVLSGICDANRDSCLAYVVGAVDAFVATQWVNGARLPFCIPAGVTNEQLTQASVRYLRFHPERLDANAATLVVLALRDTFPCQASAPPPPPPPQQQPRPRGR